MTDNVKNLLKLINDNPDLPVLPMVLGEIVADDGDYRWPGKIGAACVQEYVYGDETIHFRGDVDFEETLTDSIGQAAYESMTDEAALRVYNDLPWIKAIAVNIDLPD